jgi:hypothetical protein
VLRFIQDNAGNLQDKKNMNVQYNIDILQLLAVYVQKQNIAVLEAKCSPMPARARAMTWLSEGCCKGHTPVTHFNTANKRALTPNP